MTPDEAKQLWEQGEALRQNYDTLWQDVVDFVLPDESDTNSRNRMPGQRRGSQRYDGTGHDAAQTLTNQMSALLTDPSTTWFELHFRHNGLDEQAEVREWLERGQEVLYDRLDASNFYAEVARAYMHLVGFGTAGLTTEEKEPTPQGGFGGFSFRVEQPRQLVLYEGPDGNVTTTLRKIVMPLDAMRTKMERLQGYTSLGPYLERLWEESDEAERRNKVTVMHVLSPIRGEPHAYLSQYICEEGRHVIAEHQMHEMATAVGRFRTSVDESPWGSSPAIKALPDILSLNEAKRLELRAWAKDIDPPYQVRHKGIVGDIDLNAGELTYVRMENALVPLLSGGRYDVSQYKTAEAKEAIYQYFMVDSLRLIMGDRPAQMTASEFAKRVSMALREVGPVFFAMYGELVQPTIRRAFNMLVRARELPPPPDILFEAANVGVDLSLNVVSTGPLARAQQFEEVAGILQGVEQASLVAQATGRMDVLDRINGDEAVRRILERGAVPAEVMLSDDEMAKVRKQRAEQQQQAMLMQMAGMEAQQGAA